MKVYNGGTRRVIVGPGKASKKGGRSAVVTLDPKIDDGLPSGVPRLGSAGEVPDTLKNSKTLAAVASVCSLAIS